MVGYGTLLYLRITRRLYTVMVYDILICIITFKYLINHLNGTIIFKSPEILILPNVVRISIIVFKTRQTRIT